MSIYLYGRLVVFLLPTLIIGLVVCCILGWWLRLPVYETGIAALLVVMLLTGYVAFIVWGSAADENIDQVAEGMMQSLMLEELPITPRRLQLLGLSTLMLAGMFALAWKLPFTLSIAALALLDGVVYIGMWRFGIAHLKRLVS